MRNISVLYINNIYVYTSLYYTLFKSLGSVFFPSKDALNWSKLMNKVQKNFTFKES